MTTESRSPAVSLDRRHAGVLLHITSLARAWTLWQSRGPGPGLYRLAGRLRHERLANVAGGPDPE
jgi:hypothetical protein